MTLTKTANIKKIVVGNKVIWTITVTNNGITNATGVKATDKLPKSLKFLSYNSTKGQYNPNTGIWDIGEIAVNETVTLNITTKVLISGKITNTSSITSNEEDKNTTNNKDTETIEATQETKPIKKEDPKKETPNKKDTNKTLNPVEKSKTHKVSDKNQTGNPIILLILALVAIPLRKIKK